MADPCHPSGAAATLRGMTGKPGRPTRQDTPSVSILQVRCTPEERRRWTAAAEREGVPLGSVVRRLLDLWAERVNKK